MSDRRVESLARVICEYSLRVEPGQLMLIEAPALAEPLVLEIVTRALEMGALPRVRVAAEGTQLAFLSEAAEEQLTTHAAERDAGDGGDRPAGRDPLGLEHARAVRRRSGQGGRRAGKRGRR